MIIYMIELISPTKRCLVKMGLFDDMLLSYISLLLQLCLPWQTGKRAPWQQRLLSQRVLQKPPAPHLQPADELTG